MAFKPTAPRRSYRFRVALRRPSPSPLRGQLRLAGLPANILAQTARLYTVTALTPAEADQVANLLTDPVAEACTVVAEGESPPPPNLDEHVVEVHLRPGVMDPAALSIETQLRDRGLRDISVRTAQEHRFRGPIEISELRRLVSQVLANEVIEEIVTGPSVVAPPPMPQSTPFDRRRVTLRGLDDDQLAKLSRDAHLFLSLDEMRTIRAHYEALKRDPTDLELETLAQTWSEHCVHKTLKSAVSYRGAPFPTFAEPAPHTDPIERNYDNLLRETIVAATRAIMESSNGPECLSVFVDNAGVIGFDDSHAIAFKVETHNHPSAIEPYGGAATGIGGCIRDIMGCGLGAQPIANTNVFCVAPSDWPDDALPTGVLHPRRVLRGVARGVADYGNRMGIPTVNGAVYVDPRYLGNPLVYAGCVGLIPRNRIEKRPEAGDLVVLIGGRTGRDGIHGATFSSVELTDGHAVEFGHAVQIGNAISQKRCLDGLMRARDHANGCLFSAVTDCGAGGLSSAVGEMGEHVGVEVELTHVPLKYAGLRYDEIWISEAQERMVLAVPESSLEPLLAVMREEEVEASVIGRFGLSDPSGPLLRVKYQDEVVGELPMTLLHDGVPMPQRVATWTAPAAATINATDAPPDAAAAIAQLRASLQSPNTASREWIIRQYDHEVQGASVIKPLCGPHAGPADGAVLRPKLGGQRGIALSCGLAPHLSDADPYWMAANAIDEAIRNIVSVGGDPRTTALLDNFCWGRTDDPNQMGALVRACQACHDFAVAYQTPFISGKDSLNNEMAIDAADVAAVKRHIHAWFADAPLQRDAALAHLETAQRLRIPATLLISAVSVIADVAQCQTPDLKRPGATLMFVGGFNPLRFNPADARAVHLAVANAIESGDVTACHDVSDGGWLTAIAEMAFTGRCGARIDEAALAHTVAPFASYAGAYVVECRPAAFDRLPASQRLHLGETTTAQELRIGDQRCSSADLRSIWSAPSSDFAAPEADS